MVAVQRPEDVTGRVFERSTPSHLQVSVAAAFVDEQSDGLRILSLGEFRGIESFRLPPNQILQGRDGIGRLDVIDAGLMRLIAKTITPLSGAEWFILLRAARDVLDPFLAPTIEFETFEIAHEAGARSPTRVSADELWGLELSGPTQRQLHLLDRLLGSALFLQKIRTIRRRIEKEQSFYAPGSGDLLDFEFNAPHVFADEHSLAVEAAIARHDDRQHGEPGGGAALGVTGIAWRGEPRDSNTVFAWFDGTRQPDADWFDVADNDPWFAQLVNLQASVPAAYAAGEPRPIRVDVMSALLNFTWGPIILNGNSGTWSRSGYAILPVDPYLNKIQESLIAYGHAPQGVVAELRSSRTTYRAGPQFVVDLERATSELLLAHERPSDGAGANRWGKAFEEEVQDLVDSTPWRPDASVRTLVGRRIKRTDGTTLTDIDAVAFKDGTLILIDAKAYQFKQETRIGVHSAIRVMREKVETAAKDWSDNIQYVRNHPEILHLDGVQIAEIHGLVALPSVPFVLDGPATERVVGLFRACTVHELRARLRANS